MGVVVASFGKKNVGWKKKGKNLDILALAGFPWFLYVGRADFEEYMFA